MKVSRAVVRGGALLACGIAAHTACNLRHLRTPNPRATVVDEEVTVLIPARDEAAHIATTLQSALTQTGVPRLQVIVLDDGSSDDTAAIVERISARDGRLRLMSGTDEAPPSGWLGKTWACERLADEATGTVLVFVDADVVLYPHAIRAVVGTLRDNDFDLVAPYPLQLAGSVLERLVQPLVTWSWAATLPLRWAESSPRPSLSAANGQLLVFDTEAYRSSGGHAAVRSEVIEDVALMRAIKVSGHRSATVDGSALAHCRMYGGPSALVDGYSKSLWSAFGGPAGSIAVCAAMAITYVIPPLAAVLSRDASTRRWGRVGYAAGAISRALVARRTRETAVTDGLLHPASVVAFIALNAVSWQRQRGGRNLWKGRSVVADRLA